MQYGKRAFSIGLILLTLLLPLKALASDVLHVQLFFGLSIPNGGNVSQTEWNDFVSDHIASRFDGFNIVDSTGYWKGKAETSKIVTIILKQEELGKAESIAHAYATLYHQDSVMLVQSPVTQWEFVEQK
ncbi:DUF3574 domain-containing protein [Vibrio sp. MarTm2]|uniref:DUF3574 domain-containing protein n=1 Tax=Vibrio sp. MarTm2 TaxID=2998831 RepID=UPI0022CD2A06|nr:DUF3574 domain-containing protein [Vibrio sp. MarTm2]MDA0127832.1 DUF3574 domain-containing protein [Vibrio sp. MarTm2]